LNPKNESPRQFAVLRTAISSSIKRLRAHNQVALRAKVVFGIGNEENYQDLLAKLPSAASERERQPSLQQEHQESGSNEVGISLFVDEDWFPWVFPKRKFARKPCTSACVRPPVSSLTFGRDFTPADVASKSCRPKSRGHCLRNLGDRTFGEPFWPEPVVAQGQGRVDCRGPVPEEHSSPRRHP